MKNLIFSSKALLTFWVGCVLLLVGCKKTTTLTVTDNSYYASPAFFLKSNDNFSTFYGYANTGGYIDSLGSAKPYTVLLFQNLTYDKYGYLTNDFRDSSGDAIPALQKQYISYHLIPGLHPLKSLPLGKNQILLTSLGIPIYISKYLNGNDTSYTVNGISVDQVDIHTGSDLIEYVNTDLIPKHIDNTNRDYPIAPNFNNAGDVARATKNLLFLGALLQKVKLDYIFNGADAYTFFAPTNEAFGDPNFTYLPLNTIEQINSVDTAKAADMLRGCIVKGRYFISDLVNGHKIGDSYTLTALNGKLITVHVDTFSTQLYNSANRPTVFLTAPGNDSYSTDFTVQQSFPVLQLGFGYIGGSAQQYGIPTLKGNVFFIDRMLIP